LQTHSFPTRRSSDLAIVVRSLAAETWAVMRKICPVIVAAVVVTATEP
jgi:hypothetical protein